MVCRHRSDWCVVSLQEINASSNVKLPCYNCTRAWSLDSIAAACNARVLPRTARRPLGYIRALRKAEGISNYHAAPDDEAAARAASAFRALASAFWTLGVSGCDCPNMRFHDSVTDSRVVTASRRSSSVAPGSSWSAFA